MRRRVWPPSRPRASSPPASRSKETPRSRSSRTAAGASSTSARTAEGRQRPRPGGDRVGGVPRRRVARLQRRREAALGPEAGALGERRARDHADRRAQLGRAQRRPQPGRPAADDGDVALAHLGYRPAASRLSASICPRSQAAAASRARVLAVPHPARAAGSASAAASLAAPRLLDPLLGGLGLLLDLGSGAARPRRSPPASRGARAPGRLPAHSISAAARSSAAAAASLASRRRRSAASTCASRPSPRSRASPRPSVPQSITWTRGAIGAASSTSR